MNTDTIKKQLNICLQFDYLDRDTADHIHHLLSLLVEADPYAAAYYESGFHRIDPKLFPLTVAPGLFNLQRMGVSDDYLLKYGLPKAPLVEGFALNQDVHDVVNDGSNEQHYMRQSAAIVDAACFLFPHIFELSGQQNKERPHVMVLGAGACRDIPIYFLSQFFKVTLVDCDLSESDEAFEKVAIENRKYVDYEMRDLSGGIQERFIDPILPLLNRGISPRTVVAELQDCLDSLFAQALSPNLTGAHQPDWIISALLMSQLGITLPGQVVDKFEERYRRPFPAGDVFKRMSHFVSGTHIKALTQLVQEKEIPVYFSSEVESWCSIDPINRNIHQVFSPSNGVLPSLDHSFKENSRLKIHRRYQWDWRQPNFQQKGGPNYNYKIHAACLAPSHRQTFKADKRNVWAKLFSRGR